MGKSDTKKLNRISYITEPCGTPAWMSEITVKTREGATAEAASDQAGYVGSQRGVMNHLKEDGVGHHVERLRNVNGGGNSSRVWFLLIKTVG